MSEILLPLLAAGVAALVVYLLMRSQLASVRTLLQARSEELARSAEKCTEQETRLQRAAEENRDLTAAREALTTELNLLRERMTQDAETAETRYAEQLKMMREQMQNATQEMLTKRSQELTQANSTQMGALINPLKESIREMKTAMDHSRDTHNKNTASLEKAIEEMMKRTGEIGQEADKLAHALRNESKVQGNWGELILDELLASQGLTEGVHYEKQATLRDAAGRALLNEDSGRRMIPDTILHYPDGKDAILDSKVSLTAFVDYQNADTDEQRAEALARHLKSLRAHVTELAHKNYSAYIKPPRQALNYVIMFVPNEGALQLALCNDAALWREAFEKGVFITGEQNLIAALRLIQLAWTQTQQARNQELIFDNARMLLDRVADFYRFFEDMGHKLDDTTAFYRKATDKLFDGRQSVLTSARKLVELGAKTSAKKRLPGLPDECPDTEEPA